MIFMKAVDGIPNGVELELGDIETPLQDLIDEQSFYKVEDVTVYDSTLQIIGSPSYTLNGTIIERQFTVIDKNVAEVQADKRLEILINFNNEVISGFITNDIKMDSNIGDILNFDAGVRLAENLGDTVIDVRDFNNAIHNIQVTDAKVMVDELGLNYKTVLAKKWKTQSEITAAETVEDVGNVSWA